MEQNNTSLDAVDSRILEVLQKNGRITFDELAREVQLSSSAALRRVRRLEEAGVIVGYAAIVPPEMVGIGLTACISVRLDTATGPATPRSTAELFRSAVQGWSEVTECLILSGELEYLLRVALIDMAHYRRFVFGTLLRQPGVRECKTSFMVERIKGGNGIAICTDTPGSGVQS